jgi:steroid delta-isomerase-like uncharacterized protein
MSIAENKAIARRLIEQFWNSRDLSVLDELLRPSGLVCVYGGENIVGSAEQWKGWLGAWMAAFPDLHFVVEDLIAEDDKVVIRMTFRGTHLGEFWDTPATGRMIEVSEMLILRIVDGKIVEAWEEYNELGQRRQMGIIN